MLCHASIAVQQGGNGPIRAFARSLLEEELRMRQTVRFVAAIIMGSMLGSAAALAQAVAPDEAVRPDGAVAQKLTLTAAQKSAIYNAVFQQPGRPHAVGLAANVGAPVPPSAELRDFPDQATAGDPWAALLKYALVENDIVVVDPVMMRVVDVIHGKP
jgi:hypothetical protein